jgi:hypothetical protein
MRALHYVSFTAGLMLLASLAPAQTSYPMITHMHPVAVQRGSTVEVTVEGQMNFAGTYKALFEGTGISAEIAGTAPVKGKAAPAPGQVRAVKMKLTIAPDAALGVREFRLASALGVSSVGQLLIVDDPVVIEKLPNNTRDKAQSVPVPAVVCGKIRAAEDVGFYKFRVEAGQTLTFEVYGARIQDKIHDLQKHADPMLTLYDAAGRELAANDDYYFADPMLSYTFAKGGDYTLQIRDSKYDGDPRWVYALLVTNRPYVAHVYPMAGNPGQEIPVEPVGSAKLAQPKASLRVPKELGLTPVQLDVAGGKTNPTAFVVSSLPQVLEQEPNDTPEQAQRVRIPGGINGKIGARRDLDHYVFQATKGKAIRFEVKARRFGTMLQSSLDSFIDIMTPKGQVLASNDDLFGKDAGLVFTPPADGDYVLRIRDLNSKGGDGFIYHVEGDFARPDFTLRCDPDKAMIGPGSSTAWYVHVVRQNGFDGPVKIDVKNLPEGVTVNPLTIPPSMTQGLLVLTAAGDAKRDAANVEMTGTATVKTDTGEETLVRKVTANQEIYLPGGGRGRFDVALHTIAVTNVSDILKVDVKPASITLKPGQEVKIEVAITRRPDYDKGVSLDVVLSHLGGVFGNPLPPGVTVEGGKSKTLIGTGNVGHIVLKAAPNAAPIENVPISVLAHVSINFVVKVSYSSPVITLTLQK